MNFKTILLFAAAFTLAFSNNLEISDPEDNSVAAAAENNAVDVNIAEAAAENAAIESEIDDSDSKPDIGTADDVIPDIGTADDVIPAIGTD